jgi:flagellar basal-body rod modification protein FlgD
MIEGITNVTGGAFGKPQRSSSNDSVDKDQFLKLLTYQLKAQNPLKPYDNQEFATTLAQFSQLEQLTDIRSLLEEQNQNSLNLSQVMTNSALPGLLGKSAKAYTDKVAFDGENNAVLGYNVPFSATQGRITVRDQSGNIVRTIELEPFDITSGDHKYYWNGTDQSGAELASGNYTFDVELTDSNGASISADTFSSGKIEAVRFKGEGTMLVINGVEVSLNNVSDISTDN